ncbi:MAG: mercuric reductase [Rhizobiales bacterium]|nr:mercuric reductase [Hyphomicrobiales bacterium]NRB14492.1 mercuric reductase [Hyphomicrobiales bacterium]
MTKHFKAIIIGAGQAGPALAAALSNKGQKVALIEGHLIGGSCVNVGCTPTKTLRKSAKVAHQVKNAAKFGVIINGYKVDFAKVMQRMHELVENSRAGLKGWLEDQENIELIQGWGSFVKHQDNLFTIAAGGAEYSCEQVYINTGTRAFIPPIKGLKSIPYLDNVSLLALKQCPEHLIIIGGSYIGLEMGQIFSRLGAKVSIVEAGARIASREDEKTSQILNDVFEAEGIKIYKGSPISKAEKPTLKTENNDKTVSLTLENGVKISGSHIFVATGRTPNSDRLNTEAIGLKTDKFGYLPTDEQLKTNVKGVWALGDINRRGAFTHTSYHDHEIVLAHMGEMAHMDDFSQKLRPQPLHQWQDADQRPMSYALFTDPPLGRVGMSLADAHQAASQGKNILISTRDMNDIGRAREEGETTGFIRLIVDADSEQFLGATIFGIGGDEIIAVITNYMATGASYKYMQQALPVHPTVAEFLPTILTNLTPLSGSTSQDTSTALCPPV